MRRTRRILQAGALAAILLAVFAIGGHAEAWCPFGGMEALHGYFRDGAMPCSLAVSNLYALIGVAVLTLLLRRAFCGFLCPIATISEGLHAFGRRIGLTPIEVSGGADRALALLKYGIAAIILYLTWRANELIFRGFDPCYALIGRHGPDITAWAYIIAGVILVASLQIALPFCRWLCPMAALMNPFSRFGVARIRRNENACTACGECTRACPMQIPTDRLQEVRAARCTSCLDCVAACPAQPRAALAWGGPRPLGNRWPPALLVGLLLAATASVAAISYAAPLPSFFRARGTPPARAELLDLRIEGLSCRKGATLLVTFLFREDHAGVPGYLKVEAWPRAGFGRARITYDPEQTDPPSIQDAIIEPRFDLTNGEILVSPFTIDGYAPWEADATPDP